MKKQLLLFSLLFLSSAQAQETNRPNVLFLAVDDMNDWIGCLGTTPRAMTPNIDKLAARGLNFTNAHTAGVFCAPSRAAIFSGQFASTTDCYRTANYFVGHPEIEALLLEWGAIPNEQEEEMADTIRINWAVEQLQKKHDKPFFLATGIYAPHFPNYCPQKYFDLYDPAQIKLPPYKKDDLDDLPDKIKKMKTTRSRIHQKLESLDAVDDAIHGYLACMSYADAMMGRVLDALESSPYEHLDLSTVAEGLNLDFPLSHCHRRPKSPKTELHRRIRERRKNMPGREFVDKKIAF
jgi:arylsulfatase A-like enzyme